MCNLDAENDFKSDGEPSINVKNDLKHTYCRVRSISNLSNRLYSIKSVEDCIRNCRMIIMNDSYCTGPRRIILDTKRQTIKSKTEKNLVFEMVFGNNSFASRKGPEFKIHVFKSRSEILISKVFVTLSSSIKKYIRPGCNKVSPDSGTATAASSPSSCNSNISSGLSSISPTIQTAPSTKSRPISFQNKCLVNSLKQQSKKKYTVESESSSSKSNMLNAAVVLIFTVKSSFKEVFEEYLFQHFVYFELILNRMSNLVINNNLIPNIHESFLQNFDKSLEWLLMHLPLYQQQNNQNNQVETKNKTQKSYIKTLERTIHYYGYQRHLPFLTNILYETFKINSLAMSKLMKSVSINKKPFYPFKKLCQNVGMSLEYPRQIHRIIVIGHQPAVQFPILSTQSWKERLTNSIFRTRTKRNSVCSTSDDNHENELLKSSTTINDSHAHLTSSIYNMSISQRASLSSNRRKHQNGFHNSSTMAVQTIDEVDMIVTLLDELLVENNKFISGRRCIQLPKIESVSNTNFEITGLVNLSNGKQGFELPLYNIDSMLQSSIELMTQLNYRGNYSTAPIINISPYSIDDDCSIEIQQQPQQQHQYRTMSPTPPTTQSSLQLSSTLFTPNILLQACHLSTLSSPSSYTSLYENIHIESILSQTPLGHKTEFLIINTDTNTHLYPMTTSNTVFSDDDDDNENNVNGEHHVDDDDDDCDNFLEKTYQNFNNVNYLEHIFNTLHKLQKLPGYTKWIGELYLERQLNSFNNKSEVVRQILLDEDFINKKRDWIRFYSSIFDLGQKDIKLIKSHSGLTKNEFMNAVLKID